MHTEWHKWLFVIGLSQKTESYLDCSLLTSILFQFLTYISPYFSHESQDIERFIYPQIGILPTIENWVNCSLHSGQRTMQVFSIEVEIQFNMVIGASLETKQRDKGLIIFFHIVEANSYCHQIIIHHFSKAVTTISSCQVSAIRRVGIK